MNKCPHCGAALKTLAQFCEACGSEIKSQAAASAESSNPKPGTLDASELSSQINQALSILSNQPPPSKPGSFVTGLISVPTVGIGYMVVKASGVFGRIGQSPERVKLALDQNLREVETRYKADPTMKALVDNGRSKLNDYTQRQHESRVAFGLGITASAVLTAIVVVTLLIFVGIQAEKHAKARAEQIKQNAAEAVQAAKELAVKNHADYLSRYVGEKPAAGNGAKRIAVLVADDKKRDLPATQKFVAVLQGTNNVTGGLLTEEAVADGVFTRLFAGNRPEMKKLELANNADTLLLVKKDLKLTKDSSLQNLVTANLTLTFHAISVETGNMLDSFILNSVGAGVTNDSAEALALERLMEQYSQHKNNIY